jgi:hypothetical protein
MCGGAGGKTLRRLLVAEAVEGGADDEDAGGAEMSGGGGGKETVHTRCGREDVARGCTGNLGGGGNSVFMLPRGSINQLGLRPAFMSIFLLEYSGIFLCREISNVE